MPEEACVHQIKHLVVLYALEGGLASGVFFNHMDALALFQVRNMDENHGI